MPYDALLKKPAHACARDTLRALHMLICAPSWFDPDFTAAARWLRKCVDFGLISHTEAQTILATLREAYAQAYAQE